MQRDTLVRAGASASGRGDGGGGLRALLAFVVETLSEAWSGDVCFPDGDAWASRHVSCEVLRADLDPEDDRAISARVALTTMERGHPSAIVASRTVREQRRLLVHACGSVTCTCSRPRLGDGSWSAVGLHAGNAIAWNTASEPMPTSTLRRQAWAVAEGLSWWLAAHRVVHVHLSGAESCEVRHDEAGAFACPRGSRLVWPSARREDVTNGLTQGFALSRLGNPAAWMERRDHDHADLDDVLRYVLGDIGNTTIDTLANAWYPTPFSVELPITRDGEVARDADATASGNHWRLVLRLRQRHVGGRPPDDVEWQAVGVCAAGHIAWCADREPFRGAGLRDRPRPCPDAVRARLRRRPILSLDILTPRARIGPRNRPAGAY
ncbi:MAG: hypothetical protein JNM38_04180 [Acidobacteria bacterium]|nr:hypothetical protein [Acidobacteriota bacterium]